MLFKMLKVKIRNEINDDRERENCAIIYLVDIHLF